MASPAPSSPRVSVIVPSYNRAYLIGETLDSVVAQTFAAWEVIVIDDASSDDTESVVARYDARVRYLRLPENLGISGARNAGIAIARGDIIALLDSDDTWYPDKLARQVAYFDAHPDVHALSAVLDRPSSYARAKMQQGGPGYVERIAFAQACSNNAGPVSSVAARKAAVLAIGGFTGALRIVEDIDFNMRLAHRFKFMRMFEVLGHYRRHDGNLSHIKALAMAEGEVRTRELCEHVSAAPSDVEVAQHHLALARYRLAVALSRVPGREREAARLFVRAARAVPRIDGFVQGRSQAVPARAWQIAKPWLAAAACQVGLVGVWRRARQRIASRPV